LDSTVQNTTVVWVSCGFDQPNQGIGPVFLTDFKSLLTGCLIILSSRLPWVCLK